MTSPPAALNRPATWLAAGLPTGLLMLGLVFGAAGCSSTTAEVSVADGPTASAAPTSRDALDAEEFAAALKREGTAILDVRTPAEFAEGHLPGAINLDVEDPSFAQNAALLDPSDNYAVYCRSGNRSGVALGILTDLGFSSVYHLEGGIQAWQDAGGDVVTE